MANYQFKNIGFNAEWVRSKSFDDFMHHELHHDLSSEEYEAIYKGCGGVIEEKPSEESKPEEPAKEEKDIENN